MHWRRTGGLVLLGLGLATAAAAAESAALADAAEHRDWVGVRTLLETERRRREHRASRWDHRAALGRVSR